MYNDHFGFLESPFENNLDQRFLFISDDHGEILAALLYFIKEQKGFAIVCGDVGTGKTMLINSFLDRLPKSIQPIIISNPYVNSLELLQYIAKTLQITINNDNILELTDKVKEALVEGKHHQKHIALVIDEAHLLSNQALEEIRLLSNIETSDQKLLQILLVGQYELSYKLDRPEMRHLRQRININRFLSPLNHIETIQYIDHRLKQVGSSFTSVFEDRCRSSIFKMTDGVPRRINQLCDNALLICFTEGLRKVNGKILKRAQEALQTDLIYTPRSFKRQTFRLGKPSQALIALVGSVVILILGIISIKTGLWGEHFQKISHKIHPATQTAPEAKTGAGIPESKAEISSGLGEKSMSPTGTGEVHSEALKEQTPSIENKSEDLGKPEELYSQATRPHETGGSPASSPGSSPLAQEPSPVLTQLIAKAGENLTRIAARHYPDDKRLGLVAIILANPSITNEDMIYPGQALSLPEVNFTKRTIRLGDNLFYALYGRCTSSESLKKDTSWLTKKKVRFIVTDIKDSKESVLHRIFLGGYDKEGELEEALQSVKTKSE